MAGLSLLPARRRRRSTRPTDTVPGGDEWQGGSVEVMLNHYLWSTSRSAVADCHVFAGFTRRRGGVRNL